MKIIITLIFLTVVGCNRHGPEPPEGTYNHVYWTAKHISLIDGLNKEEAKVIGQCYFFTNISGCGTVSDPTILGNNWSMQTSVGLNGSKGITILVETKTGNVIDKKNKVLMTLKQVQSIPLIK